MDFIIVKQDSPEANWMWDWLSGHPLNQDLDKPTEANNNGEKWQYMGSYMQGDRVIHSFRHRAHPRTGRQIYISCNASPLMNKDAIEPRV